MFRDAAHFYHPLFEFVRSEWGAGRVPLWNPYENLGVPLAGDATSSVFYPGKLLFALPLDFTLLYNWYVVGHVALAAATSFWLARHLGTSVAAAGLAAVSYAFSGSVLFQYANVVFLVGAAWLPLALLLADRMLREQRWKPAVGLGVVLALMITGGDPQMAYNAGLLAVLDAWILWRAADRTIAAPSVAELEPQLTRSASDGRGFDLRRAAALLALAVIVGAALAAVQILPSWEAARQSTRAAYDSPRNLYELAAARNDGQGNGAVAMRPYAGILGTSAAGHERAIYDFSVGPWRRDRAGLAECRRAAVSHLASLARRAAGRRPRLDAVALPGFAAAGAGNGQL